MYHHNTHTHIYIYVCVYVCAWSTKETFLQDLLEILSEWYYLKCHDIYRSYDNNSSPLFQFVKKHISLLLLTEHYQHQQYSHTNSSHWTIAGSLRMSLTLYLCPYSNVLLKQWPRNYSYKIDAVCFRTSKNVEAIIPPRSYMHIVNYITVSNSQVHYNMSTVWRLLNIKYYINCF